jgi:hypothetical protein
VLDGDRKYQMSWKKIEPPEHPCILPRIRNVGAGSIWKCDICNQEWEVIKNAFSGEFYFEKSYEALLKSPRESRPEYR